MDLDKLNGELKAMLIKQGWWILDWGSINTNFELNTLVEELQEDLLTLVEANVLIS